PGQSGNPKGRPKKRRNMSSEIRDILEERVAVTINGKRKKVSSQTAILLRLREKALSGDLRSIGTLFSLRAQHLTDDDNGQLSTLLDEDMQILREAGLTHSSGEGDAAA
ncbi:MAG: DUF5681 domain-containing protein, partial [Pacificimonas sp.]